jgi:hypothetical protein
VAIRISEFLAHSALPEKPKISSSLNAAPRKCYEFGSKGCVIRA